jgi:hypothetical protein
VDGGSGATSSGWNIGAIGVAAAGAVYLAKYSKRRKHPRKDKHGHAIFHIFLNLVGVFS